MPKLPTAGQQPCGGEQPGQVRRHQELIREARRAGGQAAPEQIALRYGRGHLLDLGRVHTALESVG